MKTLWTAGTVLGAAALLSAGAWAKPAAKPTMVTKTKTMAHTAAKPHAKWAKSGKHTITPVLADKAARAKYHGKMVGKPVMQEKNGIHDYGVRLLSGKTTREVKVNAATGKIESARIVTPREKMGSAIKSKRMMHPAAANTMKAKKAAARHS